MSIVDNKLAALAGEISCWESKIIDHPQQADRLLDRLYLLIRERDHLMSLTRGERAKAHDLSRMMDAFDFPDQLPNQATMDRYVALQDQYSAIVEVSA